MALSLERRVLTFVSTKKVSAFGNCNNKFFYNYLIIFTKNIVKIDLISLLFSIKFKSNFLARLNLPLPGFVFLYCCFFKNFLTFKEIASHNLFFIIFYIDHCIFFIKRWLNSTMLAWKIFIFFFIKLFIFLSYIYFKINN